MMQAPQLTVRRSRKQSATAGSRLYGWRGGPFPSSRVHQPSDDDDERTACGKPITDRIRLTPSPGLPCRRCFPDEV
jgi:hypothetical protein